MKDSKPIEQKIKVITNNKEVYFATIKTQKLLLNIKDEEKAVLQKIRQYEKFKTDNGLIYTNEISELKFVDKNEGKIGFVR